MPLKIAILASGSGTNAARIISLCQSGKLKAQVVLLLSNRPEAKVLERAAALGVATCALDHLSFGSRLEFDLAMLEKLHESAAELVVLAGYMRLLTREFLRAFPDKVINIHPALLPAFPGVHGAQDAINYGVKISGASVHFVEEEMDRGPLIIQGAIPVLQGESAEELQNRIHDIEYKIYPQAIQWLAQKRIRREGRKIYLEAAPTKKLTPAENMLIWPPLEDDF